VEDAVHSIGSHPLHMSSSRALLENVPPRIQLRAARNLKG
jgi:hypothetical protein